MGKIPPKKEKMYEHTHFGVCSDFSKKNNRQLEIFTGYLNIQFLDVMQFSNYFDSSTLFIGF